MTPREVFLSHASENSAVATAVAATIRNHGVPVWYSRTDIVSARQWHDEIGRALKRCDWFMILLSDAAIRTKWVKWEFFYAINHNQYDERILPVIIEDCDYEELSWTLDAFQMVNFASNQENAYVQIFRTWGLGFDRMQMA
jgi:hypothetical protein